MGSGRKCANLDFGHVVSQLSHTLAGKDLLYTEICQTQKEKACTIIFLDFVSLFLFLILKCKNETQLDKS